MAKNLYLLAILLVLFFVFGSVASASIPKDTLVIGMDTGVFITCDPAQLNEPVLGVFMGNVYSKLIHVGYKDNQFTIEPQLAESWEVAPDGKTWTFNLRKDLVFANGDPLKADAVVYSFQRVLKLQKGTSYVLSENLGLTEEGITAPDDYTVKIVTIGANSNMALNIFGSAIVTSVINPKVIKEHEVDGDMGMAWLNENSAGSGPYVIQEWERNVKLVLVANENYWGETPLIKNIVIQTIPESSSRLLLLEKGDIDVAYSLTTDQVSTLEKSPDIHIVSTPELSIFFLGMNAGWGPFKDVRIRQAVKYAIDDDAVIQVTWGGYAIKNQQIIGKGCFGYVEDNPYSLNLEKARELMAEAGYADGFEVELVAATFDQAKNAVVVLQENLAKIGIRANIVLMQVSPLLLKFRQQGMSLLYWGWQADFADPANFANSFANYRVEQLAWRFQWYDDYAADLTEAAAKEINEDRRFQMYRDLTNYFQIYSPFAVIFQPLCVWGVRNEVKDWDKTIGGYRAHFDLTKTSK